MKKNNLFSLMVICLLVCGTFTNVSAQETTDTEQQTIFGIRSVGVQIGWYNPSMDYWNDPYFKDNNWGNKFEGSFYYGVFLDLNIINNLRVRTGFSYWKETVESGEIQIGGLMGSEKLELSLTSIPIDFIYQPTFMAFEKFRSYVGIGGSFLFIQDKYTRLPDGLPEEEVKEQGQDFTGHFILGIERPIVTHFSVGLEFNYVFGKYVQEVKSISGDITEENVSLMGPQIGITLAYTF